MGEVECKICNKKFASEESLSQHSLAKHPLNKEKKKSNFRMYFILLIIGLIIIFSSLSVYSYMNKPGQYDEFAKCLTEKSVVVYGNDCCQYTIRQLNFLGKSKKYLNYVKCIDNKELCDQKGVKITPTWEINGEMYEQVQSLDKLAVLSGCSLN